MPDKLKVGIVGCGAIATMRHIPVYISTDEEWNELVNRVKKLSSQLRRRFSAFHRCDLGIVESSYH